MAATVTTWSKTVGTSVLALQTVASNTVVISSAIDVSTAFAGWVTIHFGREVATALTLGAIFRIEGSSATSGDGYWFPLCIFQSVVTACADEVVTGTNSAGQNIVTCASTTGFAAEAQVFFLNTTIGNSEWGRVKSIVANTSVTLEDNLLFAQNSGASTMYTLAEYYQAKIDLSAIKRLRVVADCSGTGQATACQALLNTGDSLSTV